MPESPRQTLATSRLRARTALAAAAALNAAADAARRRDPLRGAALPLALAAGWCAVTDAPPPART